MYKITQVRKMFENMFLKNVFCPKIDAIVIILSCFTDWPESFAWKKVTLSHISWTRFDF